MTAMHELALPLLSLSVDIRERLIYTARERFRIDGSMMKTGEK